jgi:glycosyltransferase involved in cell wall biosynthesis
MAPTHPFYLRQHYPDKLLVLYVGRTTYQKGVDMLLEVVLPENVHLCMMSSAEFGDGKLLKAYEQYAQSHYDSFTWLGPHFAEDKLNIMNQCDAVICPSVYEPYGLVGLETILFSKAVVISSGIDGMQDYLVEGGYIHCGTTLDTLQQALREFSQMNPAQRTAMVEVAKTHCQHFV